MEVSPHGLVGLLPDICLMVFKNKAGNKKFGISLSPLQGEMTIQQGSSQEEPFRFMTDLLEKLNIKINKCYFLSCKKGHIKTKVELKSLASLSSLLTNARDIIPLAIHSHCRFYCTDKFIEDMQDQKMQILPKKSSIQRPKYLN